ncbi:AraC family transcriptional regulator [Leucothrix arctica]|uniref:AraC family transcriptional regulator n=1 Tax=Leucothrix arctica TaxID=1481894 RepID=A0A317CBE5_9GAMM|nr:AraC family transcriptional regulator [Leucothrix arctica]PWQ95679.1 AraC family transcriptional regulator [Leucothrix arctica]
MNGINRLLDSLKIEANVYHNGKFCGNWAVDTSGSRRMSFHIVTQGQCFFELNGENIELFEGDAVFLPSDVQHKLTNTLDLNIPKNATQSVPMTDRLDAPSTGLVCGDFNHNHAIFDKLVQQMPELLVVRRNDNNAISKLVDLMLEEAHTSNQHNNVLLNRLSDCLFYLLVRDNLNIDSGVFAAFAHPQLGKAMELIHATVTKKKQEQRLSLEELANACAMSRSAFATLFKEVVGQTPVDYQTQWRMTQAYRWLADDGISTLEAALRCGYESEGSFSKAFKRVIGVGPGKVRSGKDEL